MAVLEKIRKLGKASESMGKLKSAEGVSGEDLAAVALEMQTGSKVLARRQRYYGSATVFHLGANTPRPSLIEYPTILANHGEVELSSDQLVEEIELVLEMKLDDDVSAPTVYSIRVVSPARWDWPANGPSVSAVGSTPGRIAELEVGYIHHEVLYGMSPGERSSLLGQILLTVEAVEINVSSTGSSPVRTIVQLKAA